MKTIAYQGVCGAYSYLAALTEFGKDNMFVGLPTFREVFEHVASGQADCAVLPIENSVIGSIYEIYDLLDEFDVNIVSERFSRIEHCLVALPHANLSHIRRVLSHVKALEQCSRFFREHPAIESVIHMDTAGAAAEVAAKADLSCAAIASAATAPLYGLTILQKGIEDDPKNYTRFVTIVRKGTDDRGVDKCSLQFQVEHRPGSLVSVLQMLAQQGVNLTKIESRPIRGRPFEYVFYIDFEFLGQRRCDIEAALQKLTLHVQRLRVLGWYRRGEQWSC